MNTRLIITPTNTMLRLLRFIKFTAVRTLKAQVPFLGKTKPKHIIAYEWFKGGFHEEGPD